MGGHVTGNRSRGVHDATRLTCRTPPGRGSPDSSWGIIGAAGGPAHRSGGAHTSTPPGMCCAPAAPGATSPSAGQPPMSTSCAGAAPAPGPTSRPRSAARPAPDQDATADHRPPWSTAPRSQRPRSPARPDSTAPVADAAAKAGVTFDIVSGLKPGRRFIGQPRRWVVEPTNGWINHCRRLDRHYETTLEAHAGFLILSQIALLLRRLDRTQLFDTP
ncbi:MAG: hypothetical protein QOJ28_865 [Mycobacterium sp.]|jgi:transposase|nr:hypothetical protein [Mycobacterium sp.]